MSVPDRSACSNAVAGRDTGWSVPEPAITPRAAAISGQARVLHALVHALTEARGSDGLIGRTEAESLAEQVGALVSELVEAGAWAENDLSFLLLPESEE